MAEVRYSINGKYFKDFGVFVSDSLGIADTLKRKPVKSYDWAEYHGLSVDLSNPKFEAREIELKCFIVGANWQDLFDKFNSMVRDEFSKSGTQRLLIEPFGHKPLPYEVYMTDEIKVNKTFRNGQMVAIFSMKMIEPNPIKKVLKLVGNTLNLSYNSTSETEIFFNDGTKQTAKGNVSLSGKVLANRVVSGYAFEGRNLLKSNNETSKQLIAGETYTLSFKIKEPSTPGYKFPHLWRIGQTWGSDAFTGWEINTRTDLIVITFTCPATDFYYFVMEAQNPNFQYERKVKLERGNKATDWSPAPEDEKYIIIAGNVDEITNLTTNAEVLWEKL